MEIMITMTVTMTMTTTITNGLKEEREVKMLIAKMQVTYDLETTV